MKITPVPATALEKLARFDTPTICNTIELFDVRPRTCGYMDRRITACFPEMPPIVGYASTAALRTSSKAPGATYASLDDQVKMFAELPGAPIVVIQDLDDPVVGATFGEVMCTTYQAFGAIGLITNGAARDLDQVRRIGFPAFANGIIVSHGYSHLLSVHQQIGVGGVVVHPGDLLHADQNGVTTVPNHLADQIADAAAEYMAAESCVLDYCKRPDRDATGFAEARKEMMARIAALGERVRR